eukprot:gene9393-1688_t
MHLTTALLCNYAFSAAAAAAETKYTISGANGNEAYIIGAADDPPVRAIPGQVVEFTFEVALPTHPLAIRTTLADSSNQGAVAYAASAVTDGGTSAGAVVSFTVPTGASVPELYYQCTNHPAMHGVITVTLCGDGTTSEDCETEAPSILPKGMVAVELYIGGGCGGPNLAPTSLNLACPYYPQVPDSSGVYPCTKFHDISQDSCPEKDPKEYTVDLYDCVGGVPRFNRATYSDDTCQTACLNCPLNIFKDNTAMIPMDGTCTDLQGGQYSLKVTAVDPQAACNEINSYANNPPTPNNPPNNPPTPNNPPNNPPTVPSAGATLVVGSLLPATLLALIGLVFL